MVSVPGADAAPAEARGGAETKSWQALLLGGTGVLEGEMTSKDQDLMMLKPLEGRGLYHS